MLLEEELLIGGKILK